MQPVESRSEYPWTLGEQLRDFQEQLAGQLPQELHTRLSTAIGGLIDSKPDANALRVGHQAPDFTLRDVSGQCITLSQEMSHGPVVLTFVRGSWCPYCDLQLRAYSLMTPQLKILNARLIAVSPQRPQAEVQNAGEHRTLGFPILFDLANDVARRYGLVYSIDAAMRAVLDSFGLDLAAVNGVDRWELPVPATYIVSGDGRIHWAHVEADYRLRAEPSEILRALRAL